MSLVYLGLGSNKGDRRKNLEEAAKQLEKRKLGKVLRRSRIYESAPVDCACTGDFLNQALELMTEIDPAGLLVELKKIEADMGRAPKDGKTDDREIDLDILLYDSIVQDGPNLRIPHERMLERLFVLKPLNDIKPDLFHPLAQKTVGEILAVAPAALAEQRIREA